MKVAYFMARGVNDSGEELLSLIP